MTQILTAEVVSLMFLTIDRKLNLNLEHEIYFTCGTTASNIIKRVINQITMR